MDQLDEWMTVDDVVAEFKLPSANTVYQWKHKGSGPKCYRIGRRLMFRRSEVEAWAISRLVA